MILLFYRFIKPNSTVQDFDASKLVVVRITAKVQQVLKDILNFTGSPPSSPPPKKRPWYSVTNNIIVEKRSTRSVLFIKCVESN